MVKRMHLIVSGRVQGVCFRMYTRREAEFLGVTGWVRNLSDGSVEVLAEGDQESLRKLQVWCAEGPSYAVVRGIKDDYSAATGEFSDFTIKF